MKTRPRLTPDQKASIRRSMLCWPLWRRNERRAVMAAYRSNAWHGSRVDRVLARLTRADWNTLVAADKARRAAA